MQDLFQLLPAAAAQLGENDAARQALIFAAWRRAAGEALAEHTTPVELRHKHLVIAVSSRMWQRQLQDLSGQMLFKLNSVLGSAEVTFIEFRIDEIAERSRAADVDGRRRDAERLAMAEITEEMRRAAGSIRDVELRAQFLMAAGSCLARLKRLERRS